MGAKKALIAGVLSLAAFSVAGCEPFNEVIDRVVQKRMALRSEAQATKIAELEKQRDDLMRRVQSLETGARFTNMRINGIHADSATVAEGAGYGVARNKHGVFYITMTKIQPHLDGYKVTLNVGNPSSTAFKGGEIEVSWGLPWDSDGKTVDEISKSRRSKKFSVTKEFSPGTYTEVEFSLLPAKPEEIKQVDVSVDWNVISLRKVPPSQ